MRRCVLLGMIAALGCAPEVAGPFGVRACTHAGECGEGEDCRDGLCVARPSLADGGATGGPSADAGTGPIPVGGGVEVCGNGLDDDGDGNVDPQCPCAAGQTQACYGGPPASAGVGVCAMGSQLCQPSGEFGSFGACTGWVAPSAESCNGLDDDCDGTADEGCECAHGSTMACYTGPPGTQGVGACAAGTQACEGGAWGACEGAVLPTTERCNGVDDDCDGVTDEGCSCAPGATRGCFETPSGMPGGGSPGVGVCRNGVATCVELPGGGSDYGPCAGAVTASSEICRNGADEDCDGSIDEGCTTPTVDCTVADVLFLVDTTGSMSGEIAEIQARLRDTIVPGLAAEIADVRFAVARFDDFPVGTYGSSGDVPFAIVSTITSSVTTTQNALNTLRAVGGNDGPESQVEALYQTATSAGMSPWVPAASCPGGGIGQPCFRPGATPIILLITDADFHNGPGGVFPYSGVSPTPHTYAQAVAALNAIGAKVLGLMSGPEAYDDLVAIARDTGALAADGTPIVFDIGSDGRLLGPEVVRAVQTLCR